MIHQNMRANFRLRPWPFLSGQLRRTENALRGVDVEGLSRHLVDRLEEVKAFLVFKTTMTLVNVCSPKSGLSWGCLKPPEKKYWPFDPKLIFTFQRMSEKPKIYTDSPAHLFSSDVRWWGKNGTPTFVSVGISNLQARDFGCYMNQWLELEGLYTGMGLLTKNLVMYDSDPRPRQIQNVGNAVVVASRLPYNRWGDAVSMWATPWLGQQHISESLGSAVIAVEDNRADPRLVTDICTAFRQDVVRLHSDLNALYDKYPINAIQFALETRVRRGLSLRIPSKALNLLMSHTFDVLTSEPKTWGLYTKYVREE